jgi:amidase
LALNARERTRLLLSGIRFYILRHGYSKEDVVAQLWEMTAGELARLVRAGQVSSREVVQAHLERIDDVNARVNAVTVVLAEPALQAADAADRALRQGVAAGPLCGVPMTIKENIDVAGSATTQGIVPLRNADAADDAPHIAELRAAGAIPIGRTNMPEFGMRWHTDNALRGATRNPWSAGHTPGGSSGGDAAAVATGMTPLGMGNDGAGSLRWPAQCCGVCALKPSLGRVPQSGGPGRPTPFAFQLMGVHGPIARQVSDLRLAFEHMCGRSGGDPWYAPVALQGPPMAKPIGVSVITDPDGAGVHPQIADAVRRAAGLLADAGYLVEDRQAPALARAGEIYTQIMSNHGRVHQEQPPVETIASEGFVRFWAAHEPSWTHAAGTPAFDPMMERAEIARAWNEWMSHTPLVLAPICTRPAFPIGTDLDPLWLAGWPAALRMSVVVNLLGLPAVAVPTGQADGLPQAVQIIGPRFREDLCLDAAAVIEASTTSLTPIDPRRH